MKVKMTLVLALTLTGLISQASFAADGNVRLAALMRSISKDMGIATAPLKVPAVADVTDNMILDAVMRTRSIRYFFQEFSLKIGKTSDQSFTQDEFTPDSIKSLSGTSLTEALTKAASLVDQLNSKFADAEAIYLSELTKAPNERNLNGVMQLMKEAQALQKEAHTLFN